MSRPIPDWKGFLGQRRLLRALCPIAEGCKANGRPLPPALCVGPSGSGKTLLARSVATFFGTTCHVLVARADMRRGDLVELFGKVRAFDTVFIDEIHALPAALQELIFGVIDDGIIAVDVVDGFDPENSVSRITVPSFHFLAATDRPGKLLTPLKRRFALTLEFEAYSDREMDAITRRRATEIGIVLSPHAARLLARSSRGIPRLAGQRLRLLREYCGTEPPVEFDLPLVRRFLRDLGINEDGFSRLDRRYLACVFKHGVDGVSLGGLAAALDCDRDYVARDIEAFLIRKNMIAIQPRGRVLTAVGSDYARQLVEVS